jgi:subtilisin family serine protease
LKFKKLLSVFLSVVFATSITMTSFASSKELPNKNIISPERSKQITMGNRIYDSLEYLGVSPESNESVQLLVVSHLESDITGKLYKAGATEVNRFVEGAYKVQISAKDAAKLAYISDLVTVGVNQKINLDPGIEPDEKAPIVTPKMEYANKVTTIKDLWAKGYDGKGVTVAVIDTGVEPNHELLKMTKDGKLKITDYQDFTSAGLMSNTPAESDIKLSEIVAATDTINVPYQYLEVDINGNNVVKSANYAVKIPASLIGKTLLGGVFTEYKLITDSGKPFDINCNGKTDRYPVVCYSDNNDSKYDRILVDTSNDLDLTNDKSIGVYKDVVSQMKNDVIFKMGSDGNPVLDENNNPMVLDKYKDNYNLLVNTMENQKKDNSIISKIRFNFVCTRIDKETFNGEWYANLAFDSQGHGTHVAGDVAASGYLAHDFIDKTLEPSQKIIGPAPNAQIMALRVFGTRGGTSEDMYITAMQYAATHGVEVANLSLGGQPVLTAGLDIGPAYADLLTVKYGTVFTISAGNNGPGINSNGSPGDSFYAVTVGAYCPSFYVYDKSVENAPNQMWYFSAAGPTDDGRIKPDIVAPGSMIASAPMWDIIGKGYNEELTFKDQANNPIIGYAREQGTSMSSPYVAGCEAVLMQAIKEKGLKYHPLIFKEALTKTADRTIDKGKYNATEIGNGMINPLAAYEELINMNGSADVPVLTTGDTAATSWPYNYDDKNLKFKTNYDLYITPNVLFKNDDRMKQANAFGLYIRDKVIPNTVDIELSNNTGRDTTLNLSKVTYGDGQSVEWATLPASKTLSIANGKKAILTVVLDETKMQNGVNNILLKLDDSQTYQLDCTVPLTIIKSTSLTFAKPTASSTDTVQPGGWARHFLKIDDNIESFKITVEVPDTVATDGSNGRVRPTIYFPNGLKYSWPTQNSFAGVQKPEEQAQGKPAFVKKLEVVVNKADLVAAANDIKTANPNMNFKWNGTWEIDTYCSFGALKNITSTMSMAINGLVLSDNGRTINLGAKETYTNTVNFTNTTNQDVYIDSHGFVNLEKNKIKERKTSFGEFNSSEKLFQVKENEKNIMHRVFITNASYGEGARVWLYLYKANINPDGSYTLVKPMINKYINVQEYGMESVMTTDNLDPGYYVYALFAGILEHGPVDFDCISQVLNESDAIEDTIKIEGPQVIKSGETATIKYAAKAPAEAGQYMSRLTFRDASGKMLKAYNLTANVAGTNKIIEVKQEKIPLNNSEIVVDVNAQFPEDTTDNNQLYGLEFQMKYNPAEVSAKEILRGELFTDANSYKVKAEIVKDITGKETGVIKFVYAYKGITLNGIKSGNVAKIRFKVNKIGLSKLDLPSIIVGNYSGNEIAVKVLKQDIMTADPDVNHDKVVDIRDYTYAAYSYNSDMNDIRYRAEADINRDGKIDDIDIDYIINYFAK